MRADKGRKSNGPTATTKTTTRFCCWGGRSGGRPNVKLLQFKGSSRTGRQSGTEKETEPLLAVVVAIVGDEPHTLRLI